MTDRRARAISRIKIKALNCSSSHCILRRKSLGVRKMPPNLKLILDEKVKITNFVKSHPL